MLLEREWVTIRDPQDDHLRYTFDVSFLLSAWSCIYGDGCPGIHPDTPDPVRGCCIHGAYLTEDDEAAMVEEAFELLDAETMTHHGEALAGGIWETDDDGETHTRVVDGACIFVNAADNPAGVGCALHHLAGRLGEHHMTRKPIVCWQVPLHRTIEELVGNDGATVEVHTIAAYERGTWGEGGADFSWWCLDEAEPFQRTTTPVYRSMEYELREMVGNAVYEELAGYLDTRRKQHNTVRFLPLL